MLRVYGGTHFAKSSERLSASTLQWQCAPPGPQIDHTASEGLRSSGQAWSVCTPCAQAIEDDARQFEIAPALVRQCLVCRADIAHLRAGARTCGDACRNVLSRLLRSRRRPVGSHRRSSLC